MNLEDMKAPNCILQLFYMDMPTVIKQLFLKSEQLGPALWMDKRGDLHVET